MKRIRGFTEPYDPEQCDELDDVELERGFASEESGGDIEVSDYNCPRCNRLLFTADIDLHGVIFIKCRKCRREVVVETTPKMYRIGFTAKKGK